MFKWSEFYMDVRVQYILNFEYGVKIYFSMIGEASN